MEITPFDIVVIGGGTGGYVAAIRAAQLGLKTALVERDKAGGVCLHRGCIPTKVLLHSAEVYSLIQRAEEFGLSLDSSSLTYDYTKIRAKVDKVVGQLHKGVEYLLKKNGVSVFKGHATFKAASTVHIYNRWNQEGGQGDPVAALTAPAMLLSSGSRWQELAGLPTDQKAVIDADGALALSELPSEIVIAGAGQTGVEFASFYASFGVKVHLIEAGPRLLPAEDAEISGQLDRLFSRRGIQIYLNTRLEAGNVSPTGGGVELELMVREKPRKIRAEKLLIAIGRTGNTGGMGLEHVSGLQIKDGFVVADQDQRAAPGVFAIGDVTGGFGFEEEGGPRYMLAHASSAQGIYVVECLAGKKPDRPDYMAIPRCTYSQPQVASLGLTEVQARAKASREGQNEAEAVKVGKFPFKVNGRALMSGETEGFVKLVSDARSGDILGAHLTGPQAVELIAEPALARLLDGSAWELAQAVRPHPALIEAVMEAARDVDGWAIHL